MNFLLRKSILEFGSETGGHDLLLQKMGYDIYCFKQSDPIFQKIKCLTIRK
jgi:hypothetical protein